jgi:hypothetical protein
MPIALSIATNTITMPPTALSVDHLINLLAAPTVFDGILFSSTPLTVEAARADRD